MTINEYQKLAMTTLNPELSPKDVLINGVMGLCGESGEAIDIVKKWLAQGHELDKEKLAKELGEEKAVLCICHMDKEYSQGFRHIRYDRNSAVSEGARACEYRLRFDPEKD